VSTLLLFVLTLVSLTNLLVTLIHWYRHDGLSARLIRLEADCMRLGKDLDTRWSHRDALQIHERLAAIDARLSNTNDAVKSIQSHLLESEK
jgi:hypothetical protein